MLGGPDAVWGMEVIDGYLSYSNPKVTEASWV